MRMKLSAWLGLISFIVSINEIICINSSKIGIFFQTYQSQVPHVNLVISSAVTENAFLQIGFVIVIWTVLMIQTKTKLCVPHVLSSFFAQMVYVLTLKMFATE